MFFDRLEELWLIVILKVKKVLQSSKGNIICKILLCISFYLEVS